MTYQALGDNSHALADLDKTLELSPNYARAYRERAEIHRAMGDVATAKADDDRAAKVPKNWPDPGEFMIFVALGVLLNPINIIGSVAAAILLRPRWLSLTVALAVGAAGGLIGPLSDHSSEAISWAMMLPAVMYGPVSLIWWWLVRWLYGLRRPQQPQANLHGKQDIHSPSSITSSARKRIASNVIAASLDFVAPWPVGRCG